MNFKVTTSPTGLKVTAIETGSVLSIKFSEGEFRKEKTMENEDYFLETKKEIANAGYLSVFITRFLPKIGGKKMPVADKIKEMATAIRQFSNVTTYRGLNNKLRHYFDDGKTMSHADFRAQFFYEGSWRYEHLKKATATAVVPATISGTAKITKATTPAVKKIKTALTTPVASVPVVSTQLQDQLVAEAEVLINSEMPTELVLTDDFLDAEMQ